MYYEGWTEDQIVGYVDQDIEINGNTYFIYKDPTTIYGKGKLMEINLTVQKNLKKCKIMFIKK